MADSMHHQRTFKRLLRYAAISAGTLCGPVGLVSICLYVWTVTRPGESADTRPFFMALFVPTTLKLLLGGVIISIILGALLCREDHKTAAAVVVSLPVAAVISFGLVGLTVLWSEWAPAPSPQPYPGVATPYRFEDLGYFGRCASYNYEVDLSLPLIRQYYEQQMKQYCADPWDLATLQSEDTCYEATCDIPRMPGAKQGFTVRICLVDGGRTSVIHKDCWGDE